MGGMPLFFRGRGEALKLSYLNLLFMQDDMFIVVEKKVQNFCRKMGVLTHLV